METNAQPRSNLAAPLWLLVVLVASGLAYFAWRDYEAREAAAEMQRREHWQQGADEWRRALTGR